MPREARVEFPGAVYHLICRDSKTDPCSFPGERFDYDVTNQLKKASYDAQNVWTGSPQYAVKTQDYAYTPDKLNRQSVTENGVVTPYSPNALNQYQSYNGVTYNYDYNFNLREAPNWWGVFDAESRLTMAGGGGSVASFTYDGLGRCVRRIVYPPGGGSNTVIYAYDGWKPVLEFDAAGNYRASNIYGAGADEILFRWDTVYGGSIYKQDRHGNIVAVLDQWGNIAERYSYDAFGKAKIMSWWDNNERTSSWIGNRFMFQGREWLGEFNIYDYRHRMYNPGLGRFLQTDPTGFDAGDMNLFRYCGDDPVDRSDPLGLEFFPYTGKAIPEDTIHGGDGMGESVPKVQVVVVTGDDRTFTLRLDVKITHIYVANRVHFHSKTKLTVRTQAEKDATFNLHEKGEHGKDWKGFHDEHQKEIPTTRFTDPNAAKKEAEVLTKKYESEKFKANREFNEHQPESRWKPITDQEKPH
jgi:RHS repeat-associated protein